MNRNTELHFSHTPQIDVKRSKFEMSHSHKTTFNTGDIIPLYVDSDILPGDTVQMDMGELVRMATPIYPIMDNLYMDIYWFFVPHRLVWDHWAEFWGENDDPWTQETEYQIPMIESPANGWDTGSIADYMGIPTKIDTGMEVSALPLRAYCKIYNDWFRDENLKKACHIYKDDTDRIGVRKDKLNYDYVTDTQFGGKPLKAAKMHDYFTSALPQPQKGDAVTIPIASEAPVAFTQNVNFNSTPQTGQKVYTSNVLRQDTGRTGKGEPIQYVMSGGHPLNYDYLIGGSNTGEHIGTGYDILKGNMIQRTTASDKQYDLGEPINLYADINGIQQVIPKENFNGVIAQLNNASATTINALRTAFAIQKYFENAGLHGTRYIEYIRSVFGVTSSDARFQRAEYLGGQRVPINIDQVLQTSASDMTSPQGNTAGFSCTINRDSMFTKSFEEHGTLMCLAVIRTEHTYQQALNKMWTRRKWTDFYNPFFANLGEQPILNENIYADIYNDNPTKANEVFGYQEAWAEYRYKNNHVTGYMRSNANGTLDVWHFADDYDSLPMLSSEWIDEPKENVDRTIAVTSQLSHQFIADFFFKAYYTRPMPVYSVPGLIDHV